MRNEKGEPLGFEYHKINDTFIYNSRWHSFYDMDYSNTTDKEMDFEVNFLIDKMRDFVRAEENHYDRFLTKEEADNVRTKVQIGFYHYKWWEYEFKGKKDGTWGVPRDEEVENKPYEQNYDIIQN
jgi:hypothetical protein